MRSGGFLRTGSEYGTTTPAQDLRVGEQLKLVRRQSTSAFRAVCGAQTIMGYGCQTTDDHGVKCIDNVIARTPEPSETLRRTWVPVKPLFSFSPSTVRLPMLFTSLDTCEHHRMTRVRWISTQMSRDISRAASRHWAAGSISNSVITW